MLSDLPCVPGVEFRRIPISPAYVAGSDGSIWSSAQMYRRKLCWRKLSQFFGPNGYLYVTIRVGKTRWRQPVSRFVLWAFSGIYEPNLHAAHWDGDHLNNRPENLRWATPKENFYDRKRHGTWPINEFCGPAKLSSSDVVEIRKLAVRGCAKRQIAKSYGVTAMCIYNVVRRRTWNHVIE